MKKAQTVRGVPFKYEGSLQDGLTILFKTTTLKISTNLIQVIRREISSRSPVRMGANRKPLVLDSVGETIREKHKASPQIMSYVVPLLVEEGFYIVNNKKPYILTKK